MPQIPTYVSQQRTMLGGIDVYADGNAFGAQIGAAVADMGQTVQQLGNIAAQKRREQDALLRGETVSSELANTSLDLTRAQAEGQTSAPAGARGYAESQLTKYNEMIEERANKITDPIARAEYRKQARTRVVSMAQGDIEWELNQGREHSQFKVNTTLDQLENSVRMNPDSYKQTWIDGNALIESNSQIPASGREAAKLAWQQRSTYARFNGLLDGAKGIEDFDAIEADLNRDVFRNALTPGQLDKIQNEITGARKTFMTQASTAADAALDSMYTQQAEGVAIDPTRLAQGEKLALDSTNPIHIRRIAEIQHRNELLRIYGNKSASEIEAAGNAISNNGYGLPNDLNIAVQEAATLFPGVPAAYIAGTIQKEYGVYLPGARRGDQKYRPQTAGKYVRTDKIQPGVTNALTVAGELFGAPLTITSGYRDEAKQASLRNAPGKNPRRGTIAQGTSEHTHGTAIDISTAGMDAKTKAKLFDSLLQSGFTAFGDYGSYIHADMRGTTPKSAKGTWLGWTTTSPEVAAVLEARNYKGGMAGTSINRGNAMQSQEAVDYGRGPTNNSTTAVGVGQFVKDTWLGLVRDPSITQRIGLDTTGMSEQQLLDLRKDPRWSTLLIAASAEQSNAALSRVLGRNLDPAEMYMAHFLGQSGATTLFTAYKNNQDAIAADLFPPEFREKNPGMFGDKSGRQFSVKEFYDRLVVDFSRAPNQAQFADSKFLGEMAKGRRTAETSRTMDQYRATVMQGGDVNDLSAPNGFADRAQFLKAAANEFDLTITEAKPFLESEAADMQKVFAGGNIDDKLSLMMQLVSMDSRVKGATQAALNQLGLKDTVAAYAADTVLRTGEKDVATQIMRGQEKLTGRDGKMDTGYAKSIFISDGAVSDNTSVLFNEYVGKHYKHLGGEAYKAAYEATRAYYAERYGAGQSFNEEDFKTAALKVTGAVKSFDLNGESVIVPPDLDPVQMDRVFENLQDDDLVTLSESKKRPVDILGNQVTADDVITYGQLEWTGGHTYIVRMSHDGKLLVTGETDQNGLLLPYRIDAKPEVINKLASRPLPSEVETPAGANEPLFKPRVPETTQGEMGLGAPGGAALDNPFGGQP